MTESYERVRAYWLDLSKRMEERQEWMERHPDRETVEYLNDERMYYDNDVFIKLPPRSSFDPNDPMPRTDDLFTSRLLCDIMEVAITAHDRA
jgi:hypothetical protein